MLTDSEERDRALNCSQSYIVQAPAGSGKTELLTRRFLKLLTLVDNPEQIVALTFTKKAAFEMRSRIIQALEQANIGKSTSEVAKEVLTTSQAKQWHLIENPHRLRIFTIDSFCSQLAKSLPVTAGMGGMPDIEDNPNYLYQKAVEQFLKTIEEENEWTKSLCLILQHFHNRYEIVKELFVDMLSRRDQWLQLVMSGRKNPHQIRSVIQDSLFSIHKEAYHHLNKLMSADLKAQWLNLASFAASQLFEENKQHEILACLNMTEFPDNTYDNLEIFKGLLSLVFTATQTVRKKVDKNSGFSTDYPEMKKIFSVFISEVEQNQNLVEQLKVIGDLPSIELEEVEWCLLQALWECLPILVAHLQLMFKQYNKVDFAEVSLRALEALGEEDNPTDLALILDYQIKHLLVDEFQDTSSIQYQLFEKVIHGWQPNDGRTLFVVGDPMQSIYRFRGAEVGLYLKLRSQGFGEIQPENITLNSNFRSDKTIVEWVNKSFDSIFSKENDMVLGKIAYSASHATQNLIPNGVTCYVLNSIIEEAKYITEKIQAILLVDPDASISVLVRARNHAKAIFHELNNAGLCYQAIDMLSLNDSQLIVDLVMLTRILVEVENRLAWYSLFRSPVCGLNLADLWLISQHLEDSELISQADFSYLSSDGQARIQKIKAVLDYWLENQYRLSLYQAVEYLWQSLGFDLFYQNNLNSMAYFELLQQWEEGNEFGYFEALEEKLSSLYQKSSAASMPNPIQIMTIHKAKGLEFDYVFIPGLHHTTIKEDQPLVIYHEIPYENHVDWLIAPKYTLAKRSRLYDFIYAQAQQKAIYETQRLLYVAATRAKKQLIWSYVLDQKQKNEAPKNSFLSMLYPYLEPIYIDSKVITEESEQSEKNSELEIINYQPFQFRLALNNPLPWQKIENKDAIKIELTEDNPLNRPPILHYEKLSIIGSYLHRLFAAWNRVDNLNKASHTNNLLAMGLHQSDTQEAIVLLIKIIEQCKQDNQFSWIMNPDHFFIRNEFSLNFMKNNKLHTRILDKFFIDKNSHTAWIIDFKLSLDKPNPAEHIAQLSEYARLINNLDILDGKPLRFGLYYPYQSYWWEQGALSA